MLIVAEFLLIGCGIKISQIYSKLVRPCGVCIEPAKIRALMEGLASSSARPAAALRDLLVANAVLLNVDLACGTEAPIWREPAHWLEAHLLQDLVRKPMFFLTPS